MSITLSNLTISNVSASTSGATPPPAGDTYWSSVTLLTGTTGTNTQNNNVFLDSSSVNRTITRTGSSTQGSLAPFTISSGVSYSPSTNGGSGYFNGSTDSLAFGTTNLTGNFTIECWFYQTAKSSNYIPIISGTTGTYNFPLILDYQGSGKIGYYLTTGQNATTLGSVFSLNTWNHLAMVRNSGTITYYLNGTSILSTPAVTTDITVDTVGGWPTGGTGFLYNGYMSSLRIVDGTAVYNSTFTPSTQALPATQSANAYGSPSAAIASGTQLLMNFTNAGIYDAAAKNNMFTAGNTQVSTTQKKFGTTSMKFDGTSDTLYAAQPSSNFAFGTGDFTIEGWVYVAAVTPTNGGIFQQGAGLFPADTTNTVALGAVAAGQVWQIYAGNAPTSSTATWTTGTWYNFAVVRSSGTTKLYINGVSVISVADTANYTGTYMGLGAIYGVSPYNLNGYVQDFRVTKGVARYTANFAAPTAAFPTN